MGRKRLHFVKMCGNCKERGKQWEGDDPKCGFPYGNEFNYMNWNCATLNNLRELVQQKGTTYAKDGEKVGMLPLNMKEFLILEWYKDRGATTGVKIMNLESKRITRLTYDKAQNVIETFK